MTRTFISRCTMIRDTYSRIQALVLGNQRVMDNTDIQLPSLNVKTIQQWYNKKGKEKDLKILLQGITLPEAPLSGTGAPPATAQPSLTFGEGATFEFPDAPDTAGMAKLKVRHRKSPKIIFPRAILPRSPQVTAPIIFPRAPQLIVHNFPRLVVPHGTGGRTQPTQSIPQSASVPVQSEKQAAPRPKYRRTAVLRCPKCREERTGPVHQQYMGYRYCRKTDNVPFLEWRRPLQARGVARKEKK